MKIIVKVIKSFCIISYKSKLFLLLSLSVMTNIYLSWVSEVSGGAYSEFLRSDPGGDTRLLLASYTR